MELTFYLCSQVTDTDADPWGVDDRAPDGVRLDFGYTDGSPRLHSPIGSTSDQGE